MATISDFTESGASGSNGTQVTTGNSIFTAITGSANGSQPTFSNTSHGSTLSIKWVTSAQDDLCTAVSASTYSKAWSDFFLRFDTLPTGNMAVFRWFSGSTLLGDIQCVPTGTTTFQLKLRTTNAGGTTSALWTSGNLNTTEWNRIAVLITPAGTMRLKIYSGANLDTDTTSQDSGDVTGNQTATTLNTLKMGVVSSATTTFYIAQIRSDDSTQPTMGTGGGGGGTTITAWQEGFETGTIGAAVDSTNSFVSGNTGAANALFYGDPYANSQCARVNVTAQDVNARADLTSVVAKGWVKFRFKAQTMPAASRVIFNVANSTNTGCEVRIVPGSGVFQLQLRNGASTQVAISGNLATAAYHEVAVWCDPANSQAQLKVYSGANRGTGTATYDSTLLTCAPQGAITSLNRMRFGMLSADTADLRFDGFQADTTTEPAGIAPPAGTLVVTLACDKATGIDPFDTFTLTPTVTGGTAPFLYSYSQTAGTTVSLSGSGSTRTGAAPAVQAGETETYRVDVTDSAGSPQTAFATVSVNVYTQNQFVRQSHNLAYARFRLRQGGSLV